MGQEGAAFTCAMDHFTSRVPWHFGYPYLLGGLRIDRPNQVWCADITYLPMRKGFLYLVAIMDWFTRKVLSWRISNTLETEFCLDALNEAIHRFGLPEIMNTDQGSQFTSFDWTDRVKRAKTKISMDGKARCIDNILIERLWRSRARGSRCGTWADEPRSWSTRDPRERYVSAGLRGADYAIDYRRARVKSSEPHSSSGNGSRR